MSRQRSIRLLLLATMGVAVAVAVMLFVMNTAGADGVLLPWDTPPKYRIAYFIGREAITGSNLLGADNLRQTLGARVAQNWTQVMDLDKRKPLDALVIHKNALNLVNKPELIGLYQRGVAVAVFDLDAFKTAELLNDPCIKENDQGTQNYKGRFAIISVHLILGSAEDVRLIKQPKGNCGSKPVPGVRGKTQELVAHTIKEITNRSDYNIFAQVLTQNIEWIQYNRRDFESQ